MRGTVIILCISVYWCSVFSCIFHKKPHSAISDVTRHKNWRYLDTEDCGVAVTDRIIGGKIASLGQFPWLAQIGYGSRTSVVPKMYRFRCGGALINRYYVLTAAHCVAHLPKDQFVDVIRFGEHNTRTNKDCDGETCAAPVQDIKPKLIIVHKNYDSPVFKNDISLIQLSRAAEYNGWVAPLCLPYGDLLTKDYVGSIGEVAGWGIYNMTVENPSTILMYVKLPVKTLELCFLAYKKYTQVGPEQLCAGGDEDQDSCEGDSGGPLIKVETVDGSPRHYAIGIVSFGPKRCGSITPAVYTNVAYYIEWILNNITR